MRVLPAAFFLALAGCGSATSMTPADASNDVLAADVATSDIGTDAFCPQGFVCTPADAGTDAVLAHPDTELPDVTLPTDAGGCPSGTLCLDASVDAGAGETGATDTGVDVGVDTVVGDTGAADIGVDVGADVPGTDTAAVCSAGHGCQPYWCGCGRCDPSTITCVASPTPCLRDCAESCPEIATTVCACTGRTCSVEPNDAGTDAGTGVHTDAAAEDVHNDTGADVRSADAGRTAGQFCGASSDCASGLLCCYPCGIPGCMNECTAVRGDAGCPLLP